MIFFVIIVSATYARLTIRRDRITERRAKYLASLALDRLSGHRAQHLQDPKSFPEGWISMSQLRDDILRDDFSAARRQKLWEKVQQKVEQNSNIRSMVREGYTGEISRAWEWIGAPVGHDNSPSTHLLAQQTPFSVLEQRVEMEQMQDSRKSLGGWNANRPIY